jgi:hypothetical protein
MTIASLPGGQRTVLFRRRELDFREGQGRSGGELPSGGSEIQTRCIGSTPVEFEGIARMHNLINIGWIIATVSSYVPL